MERYVLERGYRDYREMLEAEKPDFIDIITPPESHRDINFTGDRCYTTQMHFIQHLREDLLLEMRRSEYLKTLAVQEAVYESTATGSPIQPEQLG